MFLAATFDQPAGNIAAKSFAVLSAVAGRQTIAGFIKELARQRGSCRLLSGAVSNRCPTLHQVLNLIPNRRINDSRMLTIIDFLFVPDAARIDRVAQNVLKVTPVEMRSTRDPSALPAAAPGSEVEILCPFLYVPQGTEF
jgi:hypothetical protein